MRGEGGFKRDRRRRQPRVGVGMNEIKSPLAIIIVRWCDMSTCAFVPQVRLPPLVLRVRPRAGPLELELDLLALTADRLRSPPSGRRSCRRSRRRRRRLLFLLFLLLFPSLRDFFSFFRFFLLPSFFVSSIPSGRCRWSRPVPSTSSTTLPRVRVAGVVIAARVWSPSVAHRRGRAAHHGLQVQVRRSGSFAVASGLTPPLSTGSQVRSSIFRTQVLCRGRAAPDRAAVSITLSARRRASSVSTCVGADLPDSTSRRRRRGGKGPRPSGAPAACCFSANQARYPSAPSS